MGLSFPISLCILILISLSPVIDAQQIYVGRGTTDCDRNLTSVLGFTCNGQSPSCQAYVIFRSQPPYNTVSSISDLLASNPSQLSQLNSVSNTATFETNKEVIIPVNCSCAGKYYQASSSYVIQNQDTFFGIANNTYQGLSTCQALRNENTFTTRNLFSGTRIIVPLRCACPTRNQTLQGVNYLLSYIVTWGDSISLVSNRFGVDTGRTLEANGLSEEVSNIYPFTTVLVPLQNPPSSSQTTTPPPPPGTASPSPPSPPSKHSSRTWVYIVIGVVGTLLLIVCIVLLCAFFCRSKGRTDQSKSATSQMIESQSFESYEKPTKTTEEESEEFLDSISDIAKSLKVYKFGDLQNATENFSPNCWIKGSVYRGTINGSLAAIKRANRDVSKEINLFTMVNHFNLIRLSGFSFSEGSWYLVFEYAANGCLTDWIYHQRSSKVLSWGQRIQIVLDVAMGLNYLHSYTSPPHVHKDIKTSNVLLDSDLRAKIANLGLARSADGQEGEFVLTRHIVGTTGYMAPEYLEHGFVSPKLDVYSFGIVVLEIVTGESILIGGAGNLHPSEALAAILHDENSEEKLKDFIDPSLQANYPLDLALFLVRLTESCLRRDPAGRPSMDDVAQTLSSISATSLGWERSVAMSELQKFHTNS